MSGAERGEGGEEEEKEEEEEEEDRLSNDTYTGPQQPGV